MYACVRQGLLQTQNVAANVVDSMLQQLVAENKKLRFEVQSLHDQLDKRPQMPIKRKAVNAFAKLMSAAQHQSKTKSTPTKKCDTTSSHAETCLRARKHKADEVLHDCIHYALYNNITYLNQR